MKTHDFLLSSVDTDAIAFSRANGEPFSEEERKRLLDELNSHYPSLIHFEDDGYYPAVVVLKAKNYILYDGEKISIKGSALKSSKTEVGLKDFMNEVIHCLVFDKLDDVLQVYYKYVREVFSVTDITRWTGKKTITDAVLNGKRTNETKILAALNGRQVQQGDKFYFYFTASGSLKLQEDWQQDHDPQVLLKKLYNTLSIFKNVVDINSYPKLHLVRSKDLLLEVLSGQV